MTQVFDPPSPLCQRFPFILDIELWTQSLMKANLHNLAKDLTLAPLEKYPAIDTHLTKVSPIKADMDKSQNLGSSNSRSKEQIEHARSLSANYLANLPESVLVCFTDGSSLGNPGPCGAGAVVYPNGLGSHPICLHAPVSKCSTSYHGELRGILLALNYVADSPVPGNITDLVILSDCQSAIQAASSCNPPDNHVDLTSGIKSVARDLSTKGIRTTIKWIPGHAGIRGNELADQAAKRGALEAKCAENPIDEPLTSTKAGRIISQGTRSRWQAQWTRCNKAQSLHEFHPLIPSSSYCSSMDRNTEKRLFRLRSGFTHLNYDLHKYGFVDSPSCSCGMEEETISHILMNCPQYVEARDQMITKIERGYMATNTEPQFRHINTKTLLGTKHGIPSRMKSVIDLAVGDFIKAIPRHF